VSLIVDLAVLAEGAATDARGSLTLVAANPHILLADELPLQFAPVFVASVNEQEEPGESRSVIAGALVNVTVEARGPDNEILFHSQLRQVVQPPPVPTLHPRLQLVAQVPFAAIKAGEYLVSARFEIAGDGNARKSLEVTATRTIEITDRASLEARQADL
jgi:hypothetical protein